MFFFFSRVLYFHEVLFSRSAIFHEVLFPRVAIFARCFIFSRILFARGAFFPLGVACFLNLFSSKQPGRSFFGARGFASLDECCVSSVRCAPRRLVFAPDLPPSRLRSAELKSISRACSTLFQQLQDFILGYGNHFRGACFRAG